MRGGRRGELRGQGHDGVEAPQQRMVAVASEEAPAEGVQQDEHDVRRARRHAVERDAALPRAQQARHRVRQRGEAAAVVARDDQCESAAGWPNISPSRAAIARSPSMSMRPVSSALPGSRSPPAIRTKSTTPSLSVSAGALAVPGRDARALGPEGDRPADELAVRAPQVVLQVAAEARGLVGLVGLRHRAEEHLQPGARARGALEAAIVGAPHEGLERALALLGQQRLHPRARARGRWTARARGREAAGPEATGAIE